MLLFQKAIKKFLKYQNKNLSSETVWMVFYMYIMHFKKPESCTWRSFWEEAINLERLNCRSFLLRPFLESTIPKKQCEKHLTSSAKSRQFSFFVKKNVYFISNFISIHWRCCIFTKNCNESEQDFLAFWYIRLCC